MYIDRPLRDYLDDLASDAPTPGGGSASALTGAMAAALASMVCRLTLNKPKYANVAAEIETLVQRTEQVRTRFQQLVQEDIEAYGQLSASYKLPRNTEEEREARSQAIQKRLEMAARVPLEMVENAASLMVACQRIAEIGNVNVLSDVVTASILASASAEGAAVMVRINLRYLKNAELVASLDERLQAALSQLEAGKGQVLECVRGRV
jgi:formiminotetrahydrofolate cyclodeaminase